MSRMSRTFTFAIVVAAALVGACKKTEKHGSASGAGSGAAVDAAGAEKVARDFMAKLAQHDYDAATAMLDAHMIAALPRQKLPGVWGAVEERAGTIGKVGAAQRRAASGMFVITLAVEFSQHPLALEIAVDPQGQIAGFHTVAASDAGASASAGSGSGSAALPEWTPPPYAHPESYEERRVVVGTSPALPGTLTLPRTAGPFPAIVLVHGSGPNDADETIGSIKVFKDLADGLASRGIAVLRYEKRTHAVHAMVATQREEVEDAAHAAVALLKATPDIDPNRIVLLGHSQGGYLAPRIAAADPAIRALVILAGPTRALEDSMLAQFHYLTQQAPDDEQSKVLIAAGDKFKRDVESPTLKPDDQVTVPLSGAIGGAYFLDVRDYHPEAVAAKLTIPIAVLQGQRDYQVTFNEDFPGWKTALASHANVAFFTYPAASHAFVDGSGPPSPNDYTKGGHVSQKVIDDLATWIAALPK